MALPFSGPLTKLTIPVGSLFTWSCVWKTNGVPNPLAGYTVKAQYRTKVGGDLVLDLAPYVALEPLGVTGRMVVTIPGTITKGLETAKNGKWDLFLVPADPDSTVKLIEGDVELDKAVTAL